MTGMSLADELAGAFDDLNPDPLNLDTTFPSPKTPTRYSFGHTTPPSPGVPVTSPSPARSRRSKKSSTSSYHTAHLSFSSSVPGFPEDEPLPLEGRLEVDMESTDGLDRSLMLDTHTWDGAPTRRAEGREEGRDPMVLLEEHIAYANRLLEKIKLSDVHPDSIASSSREDDATEKTAIEDLLTTHLEKMEAVGRSREIQLRKVDEMKMEMDNLGFLSFSSGLAGSSARRTLRPLMEENEEDEDGAESDIGWTGLSSLHTSTSSAISPLPALAEAAEQEETDRHEKIDPFADLTVVPPPPRHSPPLAIPSHRQSLPGLLHELSDPSLPADLAHFGESLHNALSQHTSLARQLRGVRAAIEAYREREEAEAAAHSAVEAWDRGRLERGIRGDESTEVVLEREISEFRTKVEESGRRMNDIMASLPPRPITA